MASYRVIFYNTTNNRDFGEATYLQLCEDWQAQFEAAYEQLNAELDTDTTSIHDLERQLEHNIDMAVREGVPNNAEGLRRIQTAYPLLRRQAELEDHRRQVIAQLDKLQIAEATTRKLDTQDDRDLWVLEGYYLHYIRRRIHDRVWTGTAEMNLLYSVATSVSDGDPIDTKTNVYKQWRCSLYRSAINLSQGFRIRGPLIDRMALDNAVAEHTAKYNQTVTGNRVGPVANPPSYEQATSARSSS